MEPAGTSALYTIAEGDLDSIPWEPCQRIGGAVAWLGHDGLLIPSVRGSGGLNLVIFTANQPADAEIAVLAAEAFRGVQRRSEARLQGLQRQECKALSGKIVSSPAHSPILIPHNHS